MPLAKVDATVCCRECGAALPARNGSRGRPALFCSDKPCRQRWDNRRRHRGSDLYDLFMALRYQRGPAKVYGVWKVMCRLGQLWREEDLRDGRVSMLSPAEAVERLNYTQATRVL